MNDRDINRMKTGLMFVPRGWATMSPGCLVTPSECLDRLERYRSFRDRGAHVPLFALSMPAFRRLLWRFEQGAQRQRSSSDATQTRSS